MAVSLCASSIPIAFASIALMLVAVASSSVL
jgi:hypothetical protein